MSRPRKPSVMSLFHKPKATDEAKERRDALVADSGAKTSNADESESVAHLLWRVRQAVRREVTYVHIHGEVRSFNNWRGGTRWYFDLCDGDAKIKCVMWSDRNARVRFDVADGLQLEAKGRLEINEKQATVQVVVDSLEHTGEGKTLAQFAEIKEKLRGEGLLDDSRKRALPLLPRRVGIVTSREGAAIHDMMRVIRERHPGVDVLLSPTRVQGRGASTLIARAITSLDARGDRDVIIVARGGGSREDLYSFDMEVVARAIARCRVPVVAGIGHESDVTLAELIADVRAATPTYAAQAAVPDVRVLQRELSSHARHMTTRIQRTRENAQHRLTYLRHYLPTPASLLAPHISLVEDLASRLAGAKLRRLRDARTTTNTFQTRLLAQSPHKRLAADRERLHDVVRALIERAPLALLAQNRARVVQLHARLDAAFASRLREEKERTKIAAGRLHDLSPLIVLTRGYALVEKDGRVVSRASSLSAADKISVRMADGVVHASVTKVVASDSVTKVVD